MGDPSQSDAGECCTHHATRLHLQKARHNVAALRASLGHTEPFTLNFVEIGNEDNFAADSYAAYRWADFETALKSAFPNIRESSIAEPNT